MRHKLHNTFSIFEPNRPYSVTRFSQKQLNNNIKPWKTHARLGGVEIPVKQKIKVDNTTYTLKQAVQRSEGTKVGLESL